MNRMIILMKIMRRSSLEAQSKYDFQENGGSNNNEIELF